MSCCVRVSAVMLLSVSLLFGAVGLSAQSEPEDLIKYRQNLMRAQAGHLGAMVQIMNGGAPVAGCVQMGGHIHVPLLSLNRSAE